MESKPSFSRGQPPGSVGTVFHACYLLRLRGSEFDPVLRLVDIRLALIELKSHWCIKYTFFAGRQMLDKQTCFIRSSTKTTGSRGSGRTGIGYVRPPGSSKLASFAFCRQTFGFVAGGDGG